MRKASKMTEKMELATDEVIALYHILKPVVEDGVIFSSVMLEIDEDKGFVVSITGVSA